jgi:hypothetical protein
MLHGPKDHLRLRLVISPLIMDGSDGRGRSASSGDGVLHDYHLDVVVGARLGIKLPCLYIQYL